MNRTVFHILVPCFLLVFAAPVFAADNQSLRDTLNTPSPTAQQPQQTTPNPYENLPEEYIQEANRYYMKCTQSGRMYMYYDCKCLATSYLDKRIELGPIANATTIGLMIENTCTDATAAAGYEYEQCITMGTMMPKNIPLEDYCGCYASTYTKLFEEAQVAPNSQVFMQLQTEAHLRCQDPALAQKLYPKKKKAD